MYCAAADTEIDVLTAGAAVLEREGASSREARATYRSIVLRCAENHAIGISMHCEGSDGAQLSSSVFQMLGARPLPTCA